VEFDLPSPSKYYGKIEIEFSAEKVKRVMVKSLL
jgi:hypothetical protein